MTIRASSPIPISTMQSMVNTGCDATAAASTLAIAAAIAALSQVQTAVLITNSSGQITWTFPVAFGIGITPVVVAEVLATANQPYSIRQVALSNTAVTLQVLGSAAVTVLGVSVLAGLVASPAGLAVHVYAKAPS